jgi:hypothetical protein
MEPAVAVPLICDILAGSNSELNSQAGYDYDPPFGQSVLLGGNTYTVSGDITCAEEVEFSVMEGVAVVDMRQAATITGMSFRVYAEAGLIIAGQELTLSDAFSSMFNQGSVTFSASVVFEGAVRCWQRIFTSSGQYCRVPLRVKYEAVQAFHNLRLHVLHA